MFKQSLKLFKLALKDSRTLKKNLVIVLAFEAISILGLYFLNKQYGFIYQGIQDYNIPLIWKGIGYFSAIAGGLVVVNGLVTYYTNKLAFDIRSGLTVHFLQKLSKYSHIDNLEQRVQEDLRNFGEKSCEFWFAVLRSAVKLPIFLGVIIMLTKWWVGTIILIAVILGTWLTKWMASSLIGLQAHQESNEAAFRTEIKSRRDFQGGFIRIHSTFLKINKQIKKLSFLQNGLGQMFVLFPFVILMPMYIAKAMTMGSFMQAVNALGKVIDSLTVLIDNRQLIVNISTCLKRMEVLEE